MKTRDSQIEVGTITVREDYEVRHTGETASNYTVVRVYPGDETPYQRMLSERSEFLALLRKQQMPPAPVNHWN